jgi:FMN-dependent NADH-azoreductase
MPVLLAINTSPMTRTAVTRRLVEAFVCRWQEKFPGGRVVLRDLGVSPPPHLDERTLLAFSKPPDQLGDAERETLRHSDELVSELLSANHVVIGSPMYNFTVTSGLKAWIDLVGRAGKTFDYTPDGPRGLLSGRRVFILTARGGFYTGGSPDSGMDYQENFLRSYFRFLGIEDVSFVHAEGQGIDTETASRGEALAIRRIEDLFCNGQVGRVA